MINTAAVSLVVWFFIGPCLWILGSFFRKGIAEKDNILQGIFYCTIGLGFFAYILVFLVSLKFLNAASFGVTLAIILIFGFKNIKGYFAWLYEIFNLFRANDPFFAQICKFIFTFFLLITALFCLLPETAGDAITHQLNLPKLFVQSQSLAPFKFDFSSYRSLLGNCLYMAGFLFNHIAISKFFHWICGVLLILGVLRKAEVLTKNKNISWFIGVMLWLTPTLMNEVTTCYVDILVALFIFVAVLILEDGCHNNKATCSFFLSGLLLGFAVATKLLALTFFPALLITAIIYLIFKKVELQKIAHLTFVLSLGTLIGVGYWLIRNYYHTGNPVYPYFGSLFKKEDFDIARTVYFNEMGLPRSLQSFLLLIWNITLMPQFFDQHHWVGPFYLLMLPIAIYGFACIKESRFYLILSFWSATTWYFTAQSVRYLLPALPVYLIGVSIVLVKICESLKSKLLFIFKCAGVFLVATLSVLSLYHYRFQFLPFVGSWNVDTYLKKMERTIPIATWINTHLPKDAKILIHGEVRWLYFDRELLFDYDANNRTGFERRGRAEAIKWLKENKVTYILNAYNLDADTSQSRNVIDEIVTDSTLCTPVVVQTSENIRENRFKYLLCKLN